MGQNAAVKITRRDAPAPDFPTFICERLGTALSGPLGVLVAVAPGRHTRPRLADLRRQFSRPQLVAALPQPGGVQAWLFAPERLARLVAAARLGARPDAKPLSAIDLALAGLLAEAAQKMLSLWHPQRPLPAGPLQQAPIDAALEKDDWRSFEFALALGDAPPQRLRLVLPAQLAAPPAPPPPRPAPAPPLGPAMLSRALGAAPLALRAVLHRQVVESDALAALRTGDVLALPEGCLQALSVELGDAAATPIATARLGAFDGRKVLKLVAPPDAASLRIG